MSEIEDPYRTASPPKPCEHPRLPQPEFDQEKAQKLSHTEIRQIYPRTDAECPDCGFHIILYASMAHYVFGDW